MKKKIQLYSVRPIKDLKQMLNESCELFKDKIAYYSEYKSKQLVPITFAQLKNDVTYLGTALHCLNLQNKKIAIIGENCYEWAVSYLAAITGNIVVVPIDKQLSQTELLNCFQRIEVDGIIFSSKLENSILDIAKQINLGFLINMNLSEDTNLQISFQSLLEKGKIALEKENFSYINVTPDINKLAVLLFTSGTSAESKIVMLSQKNICFNIENQCKLICVDEKDTFLSILPLHHTYECTSGFLTLIYKGCTVVYLNNLRYLQKTLKEYMVTNMLAVPAIYEFMYKNIWDGINKKGKGNTVKFMIKITNILDKFGIHIKRKVFKEILEQLGGKLRLLIAGGAAINPIIAKGFRDLGILTIQGYGLTECSPIVAINSDRYYKDDAAGLPLTNTELKIADANNEGIGEIITKGDHVMLGYYNSQEATQNTIINNWFYTGDLGFIDSDGFLHITGRKKNVIVLNNGKNVYPEEIETLLKQNNLIKDCLVYAKKINSDLILSTQVIVNTDYLEKLSPGQTFTAEEIKNMVWKEVQNVNSNLVIYKHIKNLEIRENEFEKTTTLKIKRYKEHLS